MSEAYTLKPYDILDCEGVLYRVLGIREKIITIQMGITSRIFRLFEPGDLFDAYILNGTYKIIEKEKPKVIPKMSSVCQAAYDLNLKIIEEITNIYGKDCFIGLTGRKVKAPLAALKDKYLVSKHKINRLITRWLQSGCDNYALLDHRAEGTRKAKGPYQYTKRPGRKNKTKEETSTVILTDELRELFEKIIQKALSSKIVSFAQCFRDVVNEYYSSSLHLDDSYKIIREDAVNTPTLRQFYYYRKTHSGVTDKDIYVAKNSEQEYRNNCRPLTGDTVFGTYGIGDRTEIDILDMDVILHACGLRLAAGRPHLYMIIDILTSIIPGFYVSYTNNSVTGLQGLLHNLGENKAELCRKYGIELKEDEWPSGFIPGSVFVDNGSDFASNQIMELFQRLGIERNLEPPAMGSMKGTVEQLFCQFYRTHKDLLEEHGVILKRHDSNHYEEATLDMDDVIKIIILFIKCHNMQYMENYPVTREMIDENIECSPINLFRYFSERYPYRKITDTARYQIDCMFENKASAERGEILFRGHHYLCDPKDKAFMHDFAESGKNIKITIRYTRISADFIMYEHNGTWYRAVLNTNRADEASFTGLTRDRLEEYDDRKLSDRNNGARKNVKVIGDVRKKMKEVVKEAEKKLKDAKPVRPDQKEEILRNEKQNVLGKVLPSISIPERKEPVSEEIKPVIDLSDLNWEEAMEELLI